MQNERESLSQKCSTQKRASEWLKWHYGCLASVKPRVQIPVPPKKGCNQETKVNFNKVHIKDC
jgi:hypothetical protein